MITAIKKLFTLEEYHRLTELGFFDENKRVELIKGEIIQMAAKGTSHVICCTNLVEALVLLLAGKAKVRVQDPILLPSSSEPEPDIVIARKRDDNYRISHPTPEDIILLIEIADSSLDYDQQVKLPLYAEAGLKNYWIFNLIDNQLEVYTHPYQKISEGFNYSYKQILLPHQAVNLPEFSDLVLDLSTLFP